MTQSERPVNFSAGPAILAPEVLEQASRDVLGLEDGGLSVLEVSHRGGAFTRRAEAIEAVTRRVLGVPDSHAVLFLQGGARGQFAQLPLYFAAGPGGGRVGVVDSGSWSALSEHEARCWAETVTLASSRDDDYTRLPDTGGLVVPDDVAYVHSTSNNTLYGTQWSELPTPRRADGTLAPHVVDLSSDVASRAVPFERLALAYAGAQKNAGSAGATLVVADREWVAAHAERAEGRVPDIWRYDVQVAKRWMLNTPPTFAVHLVGLVMEWVERQGGLAAMRARAEARAGLLYDALDSGDGYFQPVVADPAARSLMNVTFRTPSPEQDAAFVRAAQAAGLVGLKGHRKVGGLRASIYNAMPTAGVWRLLEVMEDVRNAA